MKTLLAVDDSRSSRAATDEVARRTWPARSQIRIIAAIWLHLGPMAEPWLLPRHPDEIMKAGREQAQATLEKAEAKLKSAKGVFPNKRSICFIGFQLRAYSISRWPWFSPPTFELPLACVCWEVPNCTYLDDRKTGRLFCCNRVSENA